MKVKRSEGIDSLIYAIVRQACNDYIDLNNGKTPRYGCQGANYGELHRFFLSRWFDVLMPKMDGKRLISYLKEKHDRLAEYPEELYAQFNPLDLRGYKRKG